MSECVFCHSKETKDVFICSNCVQKLLLCAIERVITAYKKTTPEKQAALEKFFGAEVFKEKEEDNENRKYNNRSNDVRTVQLPKATTCKIKK